MTYPSNLGDKQVFREDFLSPTAVADNGGVLVGSPTFNNGIVLDGAADQVTYLTPYYNIKTVSIKLTAATTTEDIIDLDGGTHTIEVSAGTITATGFSAPTIYVNGILTSTLTTDKSEITVVTATPFDATAITIGGSSDPTYFEGTIHRVSLFTSEFLIDEALDNYEEDTYDELDDSKFLLSLPMISSFNDLSNDVTANIGSLERNAIMGDGATAATQPTPKPGKYFTFDGGDYLRVEDAVQNNFNFDGSADWCVTMLARINNTQRLLTRRSAQGWVLFIDGSGKIDFFLDSVTGNKNFTSAAVVNDGVLHHIVCTWRASDNKRRTYIDGVLDANSPSAAVADAYDQAGLDLYIGSTDGGGGNFFIGDMALLRIGEFEPTPRQVAWLCARDFQRLDFNR